MGKKKHRMKKTTEESTPKYANELFDNPMTRTAMAALSDDDKRRYKIIGEQLYGHLDFEEGKVLKNLPPFIEESVAYIEDQLRSGFHPSDMDDNEKQVMIEAYGPTWYQKWGYVEEDLEKIVTIKKD